MFKGKKQLEEEREKIKELYEEGFETIEIARIMGVSRSTVYNALSITGVIERRTTIDESNLIYADNSVPILEKMVIDGKRYTDLTPIFAPR